MRAHAPGRGGGAERALGGGDGRAHDRGAQPDDEGEADVVVQCAEHHGNRVGVQVGRQALPFRPGGESGGERHGSGAGERARRGRPAGGGAGPRRAPSRAMGPSRAPAGRSSSSEAEQRPGRAGRGHPGQPAAPCRQSPAARDQANQNSHSGQSWTARRSPRRSQVIAGAGRSLRGARAAAGWPLRLPARGQRRRGGRCRRAPWPGRRPRRSGPGLPSAAGRG